MKYLLLLLLFPILLSGQNLKRKQIYKAQADGTIFWMGLGSSALHDSNGCTIDSSLEDKYYLFNYKKVPSNGIYVDSVCWKDPLGALYIVVVFVNQQKIFQSGSYVRKTSVNTPDIWIDKRYKLKK